MQRRLLKLLDKWVAMTDADIAEDCRRLSKLDVDPRAQSQPRFTKMSQKSVKKLESRLAERFNLADDMDVCGNLYLEKISTYLTFSALELQSEVAFCLRCLDY